MRLAAQIRIAALGALAILWLGSAVNACIDGRKITMNGEALSNAVIAQGYIKGQTVAGPYSKDTFYVGITQLTADGAGNWTWFVDTDLFAGLLNTDVMWQFTAYGSPTGGANYQIGELANGHIDSVRWTAVVGGAGLNCDWSFVVLRLPKIR